jgi:hypothetical protein
MHKQITMRQLNSKEFLLTYKTEPYFSVGAIQQNKT